MSFFLARAGPDNLATRWVEHNSLAGRNPDLGLGAVF